MPSRQQRVRSLKEASEHVRRARELAEHYEIGKAHPDDYQDPAPPDFAALLNQIK